jgi:archaellum component FlaF (FlaF/FlaG flagellin family)
MSSGGKILLVGGLIVGGFFAVSYYRIYETVTKLAVRFGGIVPVKFTSSYIQLGIKISVTNPGSQNVFFKKTDLNLFMNGRYVAKLQSPGTQIVYHGGDSDLYFSADIYYDGAGAELFHILTSGTDYRVTLAIHGSLYANGLAIPVPRTEVSSLTIQELIDKWK